MATILLNEPLWIFRTFYGPEVKCGCGAKSHYKKCKCPILNACQTLIDVHSRRLTWNMGILKKRSMYDSFLLLNKDGGAKFRQGKSVLRV